jgi:hypothetical protein
VEQARERDRQRATLPTESSSPCIDKNKRERKKCIQTQTSKRERERSRKEYFHGARRTSKRETDISWSEEDKQERDKSVCSVASLHQAVLLVVYLGYAALRHCTTYQG